MMKTIMTILKNKNFYRIALSLVIISIVVIFLSLAIVYKPSGIDNYIGKLLIEDMDNDGNQEVIIIREDIKNLKSYLYICRPVKEENEDWQMHGQQWEFKGKANPVPALITAGDKKYVVISEIRGADSYINILNSRFDSLNNEHIKISNDICGNPAVDNSKIFTAGKKKIYGHNPDGSLLANFPIEVIPPQENNEIVTPVNIGDINNDGINELAVGAEDGGIYIYKNDGTAFAGWPQFTAEKTDSEILLADIDSNTNLEIIRAAGSKIYVWGHNGAQIQGSPIETQQAVDIRFCIAGKTEPAGNLKIFAITEDGYVEIYEYINDSLAFVQSINVGQDVSAVPFLANLDNEEDKEIIICGTKLNAYKPSGQPVSYSGWPIEFNQLITGCSAEDMDNTGIPEIILGTADGKLHILYEAQSLWNTYSVIPDTFDWIAHLTIRSCWEVYDNVPPLDPNEAIKIQYDEVLKRKVTITNGAGNDSGYRLWTEDKAKWNVSGKFIAYWNMEPSSAYTIYFSTQTDLPPPQAHQYIYYTNASGNYNNSSPCYVHSGLGTMTGQIIRDLQKDFQRSYPNNKILSINAVLLRGNMKIYDIRQGADLKDNEQESEIEFPAFNAVNEYNPNGQKTKTRTEYYQDGTTIINKISVEKDFVYENNYVMSKTLEYYSSIENEQAGIKMYSVFYTYKYYPNGIIQEWTETYINPDGSKYYFKTVLNDPSGQWYRITMIYYYASGAVKQTSVTTRDPVTGYYISIRNEYFDENGNLTLIYKEKDYVYENNYQKSKTGSYYSSIENEQAGIKMYSFLYSYTRNESGILLGQTITYLYPDGAKNYAQEYLYNLLGQCYKLTTTYFYGNGTAKQTTVEYKDAPTGHATSKRTESFSLNGTITQIGVGKNYTYNQYGLESFKYDVYSSIENESADIILYSISYSYTYNANTGKVQEETRIASGSTNYSQILLYNELGKLYQYTTSYLNANGTPYQITLIVLDPNTGRITYSRSEYYSQDGSLLKITVEKDFVYENNLLKAKTVDYYANTQDEQAGAKTLSLLYSFSYNLNGKMTEQSRVYINSGGSIYLTVAYLYDISEQWYQCTTTTFYSNGNKKYINTIQRDTVTGNTTYSRYEYYSKEGSLTGITVSKDYTYNQYGLESYTYYYYLNLEDEQQDKKVYWLIYYYSYDDNGKLKECLSTYFKSDGTKYYTDLISYNENKLMKKRIITYFDSEGKEKSYYVYEPMLYSAANNLVFFIRTGTDKKHDITDILLNWYDHDQTTGTRTWTWEAYYAGNGALSTIWERKYDKYSGEQIEATKIPIPENLVYDGDMAVEGAKFWMHGTDCLISKIKDENNNVLQVIKVSQDELPAYAKQYLILKPEKVYTLSFKYKRLDGTAKIKLLYDEKIELEHSDDSSAGWIQKTFYYKTAKKLKPFILMLGAASTIQYSDVSIEEYGDEMPSVDIEILANTTEGQVPLDVSFESKISCPACVKSILWDFGDWTTSADENPNHTFYKWGKYNVTLKVTDITDKETTSSVAIKVIKADNLTKGAHVEASSVYQNQQETYGGENAIDNVIGAWDNGEWASWGEMTPWIRLWWDNPKIINKIVLYDRPNIIDNIKGAVIYLTKNGNIVKTIRTGDLPRCGEGKEILFNPVEIDELRLAVENGEGLNVGLSEIVVQNIKNSQYINDSKNLLSSGAHAVASSEYSGSYTANMGIDGKYGIWDSYEWASKGELTPWIRVWWDEKKTINKIILWDRPNPIDNINEAELTLLKDGKIVTVMKIGCLPDGGAAKELILPGPVEIDTMELRVIRGEGINVGISEIAAIYDPDISKSNQVNSCAKITASSYYNDNYKPEFVTDGIYGVWDQGEWASLGETAPWILLEWDQPIQTNKIILHNRANPYDKILEGKLLFSDGSEVRFGALANGGSREIIFNTKTVNWIKVQILRGDGYNIGLSEIVVCSPEE